jgi:lysozyme family protein
MENVFETALGITLGHEGVYSNNPYDPGGQTKWGITNVTAKLHGYSGAMKDLPLEKARDIYKKSYWDRPKFNEVAAYSSEIAIKLFDIGVNMGVNQAAKFLQCAINVLSRKSALYKKLKIDGIIGSRTFSALEHLDYQIDKQSLLKMISGQQTVFYMGLCDSNPDQELFIRGWLHRV